MRELVEIKLTKVVVAVDTGVKTGFAVMFDTSSSYFELCTLSIFAAQDRVTELVACFGIENVLVVFEDCRLRTWVDPKIGKERLRGIGSVERDCSVWQEFCERNGFIFHRAAPKELKNLGTKDDKYLFAEITGHPYDTSEHARDAGMLARIYRRKLRTGEFVMPALKKPIRKKYPVNRKLPAKPEEKPKAKTKAKAKKISLGSYIPRGKGRRRR